MIGGGEFFSGEPREPSQEPREISEEKLQELLELRHRISNAGNNGIILMLTRDEIPQELRGLFGGLPADDDDSPDEREDESSRFAIKALKVYHADDARREYEAMKMSRRTLLAAKDQASVASVPRASGFHELTISEQFKEFLNKNGAHIVEDKVGVIIMDFIEGEDLATVLYKRVLEQDAAAHPEMPQLPAGASFDDRHRRVMTILNFEQPGGKSRNEGERVFEEEMVKFSNTKKLIRSLRQGGFTLPRAVLDQIQNSISLLHKNGIFHNDLHERNIIIKNGDLEHPRAYIVDFGGATVGSKAREEHGKVASDDAIIRRLAPLTKTIEEEHHEERSAAHTEWETLAAAVDAQPKLAAQYRGIKDAFAKKDEGVEPMLEREFTVASGNDRDLQNLLAIFLKIAREDEDGGGRIYDFLEERTLDKRIRPFVANQIRKWQQEVENELS